MTKSDAHAVRQLDTLISRIGHQFRSVALLQKALRHRSAGRDNNERLEFLGDALLGLITAELLYQRFPASSEGELSRLRASLVQQATLAGIARELRLGEHLILGPGELKSGGANRESILADALEALISALYIDAGLEKCTACVLQWFGSRLSDLQDTSQEKDAKTRLQELLQARRQPLPVYEISEVAGKDHLQTFVVTCHVPSIGEVLSGCGSTRKIAEQKAAEAALTKLQQSP